MYLCQILNNIAAILASYQIISNRLKTELEQITFKFNIPNFNMEQQTMFIRKSDLPRTQPEAHTDCLDKGTVLFYLEDRIDLLRLMQKYNTTKIWYNGHFVSYTQRTLSPNGLRVALRYSTGTISWVEGSRPNSENDCITLELQTDDKFTYQKTECGESEDYFCYQRLTVTPKYLQNLEFIQSTLKSQLSYIISDLVALTNLWSEQMVLVENTSLPDLTNLDYQIDFQLVENTNYLKQPDSLTNHFHTAVMKDKIEISILLYLYTNFERVYSHFKAHVQQILNEPQKLCQIFSLNKANRFLIGDSDTLIFQFSDTMEIYDPNTNNTITVSLTNSDNSTITGLIKDDDFYDISLPDIILSIGTIFMVLSTLVEIIRRQVTKPTAITIRSENFELTPIADNTISIGIQLDRSDLITRQSLADMSNSSSSSENSDSIHMFSGIKEKACSYFSGTHEPKTVRFAPSNPLH